MFILKHTKLKFSVNTNLICMNLMPSYFLSALQIIQKTKFDCTLYISSEFLKKILCIVFKNIIYKRLSNNKLI